MLRSLYLSWHYLIRLLPVLFVIGDFKEFAAGCVLLLVAMAAMYQFWYNKLPKTNLYE